MLDYVQALWTSSIYLAASINPDPSTPSGLDQLSDSKLGHHELYELRAPGAVAKLVYI